MAFITFSFQPPSTRKRNLMVTLEGRSRWKGGCCTEMSLPAPRTSPWDPASHLGTTVEPLPQPGVGQQILRWQILNLWKVTVAAELSYLLIQPRGGQKPHNQLENNTLHSVICVQRWGHPFQHTWTGRSQSPSPTSLQPPVWLLLTFRLGLFILR